MEFTLKDREVQFKVSDIFLPEPNEVLFEMFGNTKIRGKVIGDYVFYNEKSGKNENREIENEKLILAIKIQGIQKVFFVPEDKTEPFNE